MPLRRTALLALAVAALATPSAAAKEIQKVRVCGADGCVSAGRLGEAGFALIPPGEATPPMAPWYRLRLGLGDGHRIMHTYKVLWAPRIHLIAEDTKHPQWLPATKKAERVARRITRGVAPLPALQMPLDLPDARPVEVIGPVKAAVRRDDAGGGPPWVAIPAAALALLTATGLFVVRRRRAD
jgi:hypothetical protein